MVAKIRINNISVFTDKRGDYWTSWKKNNYKLNFNHDKFSLSKENVLRGLHGDKKTWKLLSCVYGKVFFVIVNFEKKSNKFLHKKTFILSHENKKQILLPPNYLNGHLCLSKECLLHYKLSYKGKYVGSSQQISIRWNDPCLNIKWPILKPILSKRDKQSNFIKI